MNRRLHSMRLQFPLALLLSGILAVFIYIGLNTVFVNILDSYYEREDVIDQLERDSVKSLQKFVTNNQVSTTNISVLKKWTKRNKMLFITVIKDDKTLYSDWEVELFYKDQSYYIVNFQDGTAKVYLFGFYGYGLYITAMAVSIIVAVLFVLIICVGFLERKINYIALLEREIKILKTGSLDKVITIKGSDELASLAKELNDMRRSLKENIDMKEKLSSANENLVTSLSHDLRTPLTTLMIYLELLEKGKIPDLTKQKQYLQKCTEKAIQIKALSDKLFEGVLVSRKETLELEHPQNVQYVLEDVISDMIMFLGSQGFQVDCSIEWSPVKISVSTEYIIRIVNNISSNINQYADTDKAIKIQLRYLDNVVELEFINFISPYRDKAEGTKLGVENIRSMMKKMKGTCEVNEYDSCYAIRIGFPIILK